MKVTSLIPVALVAVASAGYAQTTTRVSGDLGLTLVSAANKSTTINSYGSYDRTKKGIDNLHFDGGYFFQKQTPITGGPYQVNSDFKYANFRYDKTKSERISYYASLGLRVDSPLNLDLRTIYGLGISYLQHDDAIYRWQLSLGGSYLVERYVDGSAQKKITGAQLGSLYHRNVGDKIKVDHSLLYIPRLSDLNDYIANSNLSLGYDIGNGLALTVNNLVDFRNQPPAGSNKKNSTWFFGIRFARQF